MAEATGLRNTALPYPVYGAPYGITFPILDADGDLVTGAANLDSERSLNGDTFADCTNEATEIAAGSGMYYLLLTAAEMTADVVSVIVKTSTADAKTTPIVLYPRKLVTLASGTAQGGAVGYITLAAATVAFDEQFDGCLCVATIDSVIEARVLQVCTAADQQCTVTPDWNTAPDADDTFVIYNPEGRQIPQADIVAIVADDTAPPVLANQYNSTGITDPTYPATQEQVSGIANVGAASAEPTVAAPGGFTLTTGANEQGDSDRTRALDGIDHEWDDDGGGNMDGRYLFGIGGAFVPAGAGLTVVGRLNAAPADAVLINVNTGTIAAPAWQTRGSIPRSVGSTNLTRTFTLFTTDSMTGADAGKVQIQVEDDGGVTGATFAADQMFVSKTSIASTTGYSLGAIWVDTNASNTNTVVDVDGVADNPVSTWAAALTLSASLGITRFEIVNGSTIQLSANSDNYTLCGIEWTLDLNAQSCDDASFTGAHVTGTCTGGEVVFNDCDLAAGGGTLTCAGMEAHNCAIAGSIVLAAVNTYYLDQCYSGIAGNATPDIDFGAGVANQAVNFRHYSGGIEVKNIGQSGTDTMSLEGHGQLVLNANCAGGTIAIRGHFPVTDNAAGVVTLSRSGNYVEDELVDANYDELLTGATHNIPTSAGRIIRELSEQIGYEGGAIWIDTVNGAAGTTVGENGTVNNPVNSIADALTLAVAIGIVRLRVASGSTITLGAAVEGYEMFNGNWTLALNGQSVSGSCISGAAVSGVCTGAVEPDFIQCRFGNATLPPSHLDWCSFAGTITAGSAGAFFFDNCHSAVAGTGAPVFDFGAGLDASDANFRAYSGGVEIRNMGAGAGSYNMSLEGWGQLIIAASCSATSTVAIRGHFTVTDNAGGAVTLSDDARVDEDHVIEWIWTDAAARILTAATNITNTGGTTVAQTGDNFARLGAPAGVSIAADIADLPTVAEFEARTILAAAYFNPATDDVSVSRLVASALADMFNTDSGETYGSSVGGSVVKEIADNAAVASDPWTIALPGAYAAGTAGKIVGDGLTGHIPQTGDTFILASGISGFVAIKGVVDAILVDTGTTIENHLTDIKGTGFVKDTHSLPQCVTGAGGLPGPGADNVTVTILEDDALTPIADADVWISTDQAGSNVIAGTLQTNGAGQILFLLDAGVTYWLWRQKDTVEFTTNPQEFIAVAD